MSRTNIGTGNRHSRKRTLDYRNTLQCMKPLSSLSAEKFVRGICAFREGIRWCRDDQYPINFQRCWPHNSNQRYSGSHDNLFVFAQLHGKTLHPNKIHINGLNAFAYQLRSRYLLCVRKKVPRLTYQQTIAAALETGPKWVGFFLNFIMCVRIVQHIFNIYVQSAQSPHTTAHSVMDSCSSSTWA